MKKTIISVALSLVTFSPSWSSNFEDDMFQFDDDSTSAQSDSDDDNFGSKDDGVTDDYTPNLESNLPSGYKASDPINIDYGVTGLKLRTGSVPTNPNPKDPEISSSYKPSSFMGSCSFMPGSPESTKKAQMRKQLVKSLEGIPNKEEVETLLESLNKIDEKDIKAIKEYSKKTTGGILEIVK